MQVKSIAECSNGEHSAILLTFIKIPFVINIFVLSIFEWPFYTGYTVNVFVYAPICFKGKLSTKEMHLKVKASPPRQFENFIIVS